MSWSGIVLVLLFMAVITGLGFRPRRPWVIHAHMNKMFMTMFFVMMFLYTFLFLSIKIAVELDWEPWIGGVMASVVLITACLLTVYVLYWSQPFSRKRTGVKAVDEAVERYKKPGERAVGIFGGWCPDLVVDGKAYKLISYFPRGSTIVTGMLAFDLQGNIIQDEPLMHKIAACMRLAGQCANPDEINTRAAIYSSMDKASAGVEKILSKQATLSSFVEAEAKLAMPVNHIGELLGVMKQDFTLHKSYLEEEAKECNLLGGSQASKIPYASVEKLNALWKTNRTWQLEAMMNLSVRKSSIRALKRWIKQQPEPARYKDLLNVLEKVIPEYLDTYRKVAEWQAAGNVEDRFAKIQPSEIGTWYSRLEWVRQVDGWIAQGCSGKALEAKKREHLAEEERAEKERKREERRQKRALRKQIEQNNGE